MVATACAAGIPHHLIDILDPLDPTAEYSAGDFHDAAHEAVSDILSRGATPIVVGGTGFYLRTFMCGKPRGGKAPPAVEARVTDIIVEAMLMTVAGDPAASAAATAAAARLRQGPSRTVPGTTSGGGSAHERCGEVSPRGVPDAAVIATAIAKAAVGAVEEASGEDSAEACGERLWAAGVETLRRAGDADGAARCVPAAPPTQPHPPALNRVHLLHRVIPMQSSPALLTGICLRPTTGASPTHQRHPAPPLFAPSLQPQCLTFAATSHVATLPGTQRPTVCLQAAGHRGSSRTLRPLGDVVR